MKFKSFLLAHKALIKDVAVSTCLVGATAGVVFGVSAGTFKIRYMELNDVQKRLAAALSKTDNYYNQKIDSAWNMNEVKNPDGTTILGVAEPSFKDWTKADHSFNDDELHQNTFLRMHGLDYKSVESVSPLLCENYNALSMDTVEGTPLPSPYFSKARYGYTSMIIDGATHTTMDRSFNQSLYAGLVDFNKNYTVDHVDPETEADVINKNVANAYKPSQDNTTEFINIYLAAMDKHSVIGLAGFNHSTPLNSMMVHKQIKGKDKILEGPASNPDTETNKLLNSKGFILIDSNVPNNQCVASVMFRADQPGFLAAMATCQYLYNNLDIYHAHHEPLSVGMFGGVQIPTVTIYMGGFQRGVELFNYAVLHQAILARGAKNYFEDGGTSYDAQAFIDLVDHSEYRDEIYKLPLNTEGLITFNAEYAEKMETEFSIKMIKLGDSSTHFTGTFVAGDAIGITKQFLNRGASAIIAVAGPQSLDAAQEIANQQSKCIVVGVDTAMEDSDYQRYHVGCGESTRTKPNPKDKYMDKTVAEDQSVSQQANAIIKFSAMKDIRTVTKKITRLCALGQNWDVSADRHEASPDPKRAICGPGFQTCGNIMNGLVGISWDGFFPLMQALKHIEFRAGPTTEFSFETAWAYACQAYFNELTKEQYEELFPDPEYAGTYEEATDKDAIVGVKDINKNLLTFKRYKDGSNEETIFYKNYNSTIAILGRLLDLAPISFSLGTTLLLDADNKPYIPQSEVNLSINEWLDINMYIQS